MVNLADIHKKAISNKIRDQKDAIKLIRNNFSSISDKKQIWDDLIHLSKNKLLLSEVSKALEEVFPFIPHQKQAWNDLIRLTQKKDIEVFNGAINSIRSVFPLLSNKEEVWINIHNMTQDNDKNVRSGAAIILGAIFFEVLDVESAWNDLHILTKDKDKDVRGYAALGILYAFSDIPDKKKAWHDLIELAHEKDENVLEGAAMALGGVFGEVPDKKQAWNDLHDMMINQEKNIRWVASLAMYLAVMNIPNQKQAWEDLHRLTQDEDKKVRTISALAIGGFIELPNHNERSKSIYQTTQEYNELCNNRLKRSSERELKLPTRLRVNDNFGQLAYREDKKEQKIPTITLPDTFFEISELKQACEDLHKLTQDKDKDVRRASAIALSRAISNFPDQKQAWEDLHRLALDKDKEVKKSVAIGLCMISTDIPDREDIWIDLNRLIQENDLEIRSIACIPFIILAQHFIDNKNYKKTYECFNKITYALKSFTIRSEFREYFRPAHVYYYFKGFFGLRGWGVNSSSAHEYCYLEGLCFYYHGKTLVSELPEIENPEQFNEKLKNAIMLFDKSIKNMQQFPDQYENARFIPICLNIFSAYYEYILLLEDMDEKRVNKVQNYLNDAFKQCEIVGSENGKNIVRIFRKLTETLISLITEIKLETKKQDATKKGKNILKRPRLDAYIKKSRKDFENYIHELENLLHEIQAPHIKKIVEFDIEILKEIDLGKEGILMPITFWSKPNDYIINIVKKFWIIIVTIGLILTTIVGIIKNWNFISDLLKILI